MVRRYEAGDSSNDIGRDTGRNGRTVRFHLRAAGVLGTRTAGIRRALAAGKIRRRALNERFFAAWSPGMAWVLGLIFGDGHVMCDPTIGQYGVSLAGTQQVGEAVAALLGLDLVPRRARDADCWILQWYSRTLVESLAVYGLRGGSKATTMQFPAVPDAMLPHFLRGLWDSDGSWERRGDSLRARYTTASESFAVAVQQRAGGRIYSWRSDRVKRGAVGFHVELTVSETDSLRARIYTDSTPTTRCARKYECAMGGDRA